MARDRRAELAWARDAGVALLAAKLLRQCELGFQIEEARKFLEGHLRSGLNAALTGPVQAGVRLLESAGCLVILSDLIHSMKYP